MVIPDDYLPDDSPVAIAVTIEFLNGGDAPFLDRDMQLGDFRLARAAHRGQAMKLTDGSRNFLRLVERSKDIGDGFESCRAYQRKTRCEAG